MPTDKGRTIEAKDIAFSTPIPIKHMRPEGYLPMTTEAAALWMFLICAFQALDRVPKQTTYEGDLDQTVDLLAIARSIEMMYGIKDRNDMFNEALIQSARMEAFRSALPWDSRIDAFFATGGKSYRVADRDPDKVGQ